VYRYRLYPTRAQDAALRETLERLRELYNAALQEQVLDVLRNKPRPSNGNRSRSWETTDPGFRLDSLRVADPDRLPERARCRHAFRWR
jgi:hypothetical protein